MTEITAAMVKQLREKTGAGMMDCKKALQETAGDMEAAEDWLRTKSLVAVQSKAGRLAADGLVAVRTEDSIGTIVEVNSETDFVARSKEFQKFVANVATLVEASGGNIDELGAAPYPKSERSVGEELTHLVATIGENLSLRRAAILGIEQGVVGSYVHGALAPGLGRIGVLVGLKTEAAGEVVDGLAHQLAMHIAASAPQSLSIEALDQKAVERERNVLMEQARDSGRPEQIVAKMVEGRLRKFYQDVVLLEQTWVHDNERKVAEVLSEAGKELGTPIELTGFVRFALGEVIER